VRSRFRGVRQTDHQRPQSSSASNLTAGFLNLSQSGEPEHALTVVLDVLIQPDAVPALASIIARGALRLSSGSRRRSSPFRSIFRVAYFGQTPP